MSCQGFFGIVSKFMEKACEVKCFCCSSDFIVHVSILDVIGMGGSGFGGYVMFIKFAKFFAGNL